MKAVKYHRRLNRPQWRYVQVIATVALLATTVPAHASTFKHRAADGTVTFSDAPISNGKVIRTSYKSDTWQAVAARPCTGLSTADIDARGEQLDARFRQASTSSGVPVTLLKAVARAESCFDPMAVSSAGAKGLMQLMPRTATSLGVSDSFNTRQNLEGGARYLAQMLARYENDLDLALAAYNAGPGNVDRHQGVPPFKETRRYLASVKAFKNRYDSMPELAKRSATSTN